MSATKPGRTVTTLFGLFFPVLAVVILLAAWEESPFGAVAAALVVGFLGVDAIVSAARGKAALLARIGPLP